MKIYHGSKTLFTTFSIDYPGTGEAGDIHAVWFANNFNAARNHCSRIRTHGGTTWVYECELVPETVVLKADISLRQQPDIQQRLSDALPVCISVQPHYDVLFSDYYRYLWNKIVDTHEQNDHKIALLRQAGIDAIYDYERGWQDAHLHGVTTVVLIPDRIRILNIHEV